MGSVGYVTGFGRLRVLDDYAEPPEPRKIVDGLYSVPIDTDIKTSTYNNGDYLVVPEFVAAAKELGLDGRHGSPTFGALAKHMLRGTGLERDFQYEFGTDRYHPKFHYLLGFQATRDVVSQVEQGELRVLTLTKKRQMVARTVVDLATDQERIDFRYKNSGLGEQLQDFLKTLEGEGYKVKRQIHQPYEVLHPRDIDADTICVIVSGGMLLSLDGSKHDTYTPGDTVKIREGSVCEGFVLRDGCEFFEATLDKPQA